MNMIPPETWQKILPALRAKCPRLTEQDLREAEQRVDLLTAKIQNRHWVNRLVARRLVLDLLRGEGALPAEVQ